MSGDYTRSNPRLALSDERLWAIVDETMAQTTSNEDRVMEEKMMGARCMCCDGPIPGPPPGATRECDSCAEYS